MDIKTLQRKVVKHYLTRKPIRSRNQRFITIVEELGELAECILMAQKAKPRRKVVDIEEEFGDVFGNLLDLAHKCGVDVEKAILKKLKSDEKKVRRSR